MKTSTRLYKSLTQNDFDNIDVKIKRKYHYYNDGEKKNIEENVFENDNSKNVFQLIDEDYEWNAKEQSLFLDLKISATNLKHLFEDDGFVSSDAVLGIGLVWKPDKSKIKRCKKLCQFDISQNDIEIDINEIELPNMSSNTEFYITIYIVKPGNNTTNPFYANEQGMILYSQKEWTLIIEGNGSIFPIVEIEKDNWPIWSYYCNFNDIADDLFDCDNIRIEINKKHPAYCLFHPKSNTYSQEFVNEVLSSALFTIIIDIRSKQDNNIINFEEDGEVGSILRVLDYFHSNLGFDINGDYNSLLCSIKAYFDKEM